MSEIVIRPATADRFDDAQHALTGGGDGASCQCAWWTVPNAQFQRMTTDERRDMLRDELGVTSPAPALIAYVDGDAAGWVRVGPRIPQVRIARTRAIAAHTPTPLDDPSVWAVSCFVVRREHRGEGLNTRLLEAAIAHARTHGAGVLEAYPIDTAVGRHPVNDLYHGALSTFERAGFREVARFADDRPIVQLDLSGAAEHAA